MSGDTEIKKLTAGETQRKEMERQVVVVWWGRRRETGSERGTGREPRREKGERGEQAWGERKERGKSKTEKRGKRGKRFSRGETTMFTSAMAGSPVAPHT